MARKWLIGIVTETACDVVFNVDHIKAIVNAKPKGTMIITHSDEEGIIITDTFERVMTELERLGEDV